MLYKKFHRQFIRQFWKGRKFRFNDGGNIYEVTFGPYISWTGNIVVDISNRDAWRIIRLSTGKLRYKDNIEWLED